MLHESGSLRRHYKTYKALNTLGLGYLVLALYGFRTAGRYDVTPHYHKPVLGFSLVPNNKNNMDNVAALSDHTIDLAYIEDGPSFAKRLANTCKHLGALSNAASWRSLNRALRVIKRIDDKYGWVQALNVASFLFGVFAFRRVFLPINKVGFTANDFSPIPQAFKYAGRQAGLKQMFVMHGQISGVESGIIFPPLNYDLAFLYGDAALQAYAASGSPVGSVVLIGFPGEASPMKLPQKIQTIGICLANYYDESTHTAILNIGQLYEDAKILVRCHPRCAQKPDFTTTKNVSLSTHAEMDSFASSCDVVFAGNTGGQIDLLKLGCPIVHYAALDNLGDDDIGLVSDGTVLCAEDGKRLTASDLAKHFDDGWVEKFRKYDAQYLVSEAEKKEMRKNVKQAYAGLLSNAA